MSLRKMCAIRGRSASSLSWAGAKLEKISNSHHNFSWTSRLILIMLLQYPTDLDILILQRNVSSTDFVKVKPRSDIVQNSFLSLT